MYTIKDSNEHAHVASPDRRLQT